jgi:hypothetical protein
MKPADIWRGDDDQGLHSYFLPINGLSFEIIVWMELMDAWHCNPLLFML